MQKRVDHPLAADRGAAGALQFGIEKAEIEHRIVRDQRSVAEKRDELVHFVGEERLVLEELDRSGREP